MRRYNLLVRAMLREMIWNYRKRAQYTQEDMAEKLHISPRSYVDQEHGKYGFSAVSLLFFLSILPDEEVLALVHTFEGKVEEEDKDVHVA